MKRYMLGGWVGVGGVSEGENTKGIWRCGSGV